MLVIEGVLDAAALERLRARLADAAWTDGKATVGNLNAAAKQNSQTVEGDAASLDCAAMVTDALQQRAEFISAALPARISTPLFNRYAGGQSYGRHIDGAIRPLGAHERMRTDLSGTLFLSDPESYEGGVLTFEDEAGERRAKLAAGDLVLYPSTTIHEVQPVTRGVRVAAFFWVQSLIRDGVARSQLFMLDGVIQRLKGAPGQEEAVLELTALYHNLLRLWSDL